MKPEAAPPGTTIGFVMIQRPGKKGGGRRPFVLPEKITKGRNRGKWRVFFTRGRDNAGRIRIGKKMIVRRHEIIEWPEGDRPQEQKPLF